MVTHGRLVVLKESTMHAMCNNNDGDGYAWRGYCFGKSSGTTKTGLSALLLAKSDGTTYQARGTSLPAPH